MNNNNTQLIIDMQQEDGFVLGVDRRVAGAGVELLLADEARQACVDAGFSDVKISG
ncbi:hypothetical protein [Pseudomonas sp. 18173]|uniref:hypothetical protein n=1 Tax=Pseudomonas sp. 18173 TaxID=3390055 RepID=UPI003D26232D